MPVKTKKRIRKLIVTRTCARCEKPFGVISNGSPARFCSLSCSSKTNAPKVMKSMAERFIHHSDDVRQKRYANAKVNNEVAACRLFRPDTCELCGKQSNRIEGAHVDYTQPLLIAWLCKSCHMKSHVHVDIDAQVRAIARYRDPATESAKCVAALLPLPSRPGGNEG